MCQSVIVHDKGFAERPLEPLYGMCFFCNESPPVWRRGLKQRVYHDWHPGMGVASRVEAWIETSRGLPRQKNAGVASRVEAWIETAALVVIAC